MPLLIKSTEIDNSGSNKLVINGGRRRLYIKGGGFISCGFELEVIVLNDKKDNIDEKYFKVSEIGDEISENEISVVIEAFDGDGNIAVGHRAIVVKKKEDFTWKPGACGKEDGQSDGDCVEKADAIDLVQ